MIRKLFIERDEFAGLELTGSRGILEMLPPPIHHAQRQPNWLSYKSNF